MEKAERCTSSLEFAVFVALNLTVTCLVLFSRHFVKLRLGPLYVLEILAMFWALATLTRSREFFSFIAGGLRGKSAPLLLASAIFFYGAARLALDLTVGWRGDPSLERVLQHSLTFVYPFVWMSIGAWCALRFPERFYLIGVCAILASIPSFLFFSYSNLRDDPLAAGIGANYSVGPLAVLAAVYFFVSKDIPAKQRIPLGVILAACAFFPFWKMLHSQVQRTSLVLLLFMTALAPWIVAAEKKVRAFATTVGLLAFLVAGAAVSLALINHAGGGEYGALDSFRHDDDRPNSALGESGAFQFRSRTIWWSSAFDQWKMSPIFGVGTLAEVPSEILPGVKNDGRFEGRADLASLGGKPIMGPHNSYLGVLARFGAAGFLLFLGLAACIVVRFASVVRRANPVAASDSLQALGWLVTLIVPMNGLLYALVGVGFESPYNSVLLWFFSGALLTLGSIRGTTPRSA